METKKSTFAALAAIAAMNPDGYTVDAKTLQPITRGYSVAVKGTQDSFEAAGLRHVIDYQAKHPECQAFGGWLDSETGLYYYDACIIVGTKAEAMALAKENAQIAFFCLHELQEYNHDGTPRKEENKD